jgi:phospholipid/cholesterol/gamma-HCH transport system permease protein
MSAVLFGSSSPPQIRQVEDPDGSPGIEVTGAWNLASLEHVLPEMAQRLAAFAGITRWDLRQISALDHAGALLLWRAWGRRRIDRLELRPEHEPLFAHVAAIDRGGVRPRRPAWRMPVLVLGEWTLGLFGHLIAATILVGRVVMDAASLVRHPSRIPWREISANIYHTGAQALAITALVGFLIGVVLSYLSAQQLKQFGADIYIINLLGVAIVRELGPVLAAVLIAGRSGSAMTAQLGVMRVTEELDAMTVMGVPHTVRLILPRIVALAVALPLIVLWTSAIALLGGMVSAQAELGIPYQFFLARLPDAVPIANLWLGLGKSVVFGVLIALTACHFGLRIEPNTESLGQGTTQSVVTAITLVIIADAAFAILFAGVGSFG